MTARTQRNVEAHKAAQVARGGDPKSGLVWSSRSQRAYTQADYEIKHHPQGAPLSAEQAAHLDTVEDYEAKHGTRWGPGRGPAPPSGHHWVPELGQHVSHETWLEMQSPQPAPARYGGYSTGLPSNLESKPHAFSDPADYLHRNLARHILNAAGYDPQHIPPGPEGTAKANRLASLMS